MASNGSAGEVRDVHSSETTKTLLKSNDLYDVRKLSPPVILHARP